MSSNLYYRPVTAGEKLLPDQLKHTLKNLDDFNNTVEGTYDESYIPVLRGMKAAGVEGADKLIKAIEKYGEVELVERY